MLLLLLLLLLQCALASSYCAYVKQLNAPPPPCFALSGTESRRRAGQKQAKGKGRNLESPSSFLPSTLEEPPPPPPSPLPLLPLEASLLVSLFERRQQPVGRVCVAVVVVAEVRSCLWRNLAAAQQHCATN